MTVLHGHDDQVTSLAVNPNASYQLISSGLDGTIRFWSVDDGMLLKTVKLAQHDKVYGVKATKKGIHVVAGQDEKVNYGRLAAPDETESEVKLEIVLQSALQQSSFW